EVQEELAGHLRSEDPDRKQKARAARGLLGDLQLLGDHVLDEATRVGDVVTPHTGGHPPGGGSPPGKLLPAVAPPPAAGGKFRAVVLASNDAGILLDVNKARQEKKLPVFYLNDPHDSIQTAPLVELLKPKPPAEPPPEPVTVWENTTFVSGLQ